MDGRMQTGAERAQASEYDAIGRLHARLDKTERRLRAVVVGWVLSVVVLGVVGAAVGRADSQLGTFRWRGVEVADPNGRVRAQLMAPSDGSAFLQFIDQQGHVRLVLRIAPEGTPSITAYDAAGQPVSSGQPGLPGGVEIDREKH